MSVRRSRLTNSLMDSGTDEAEARLEALPRRRMPRCETISGRRSGAAGSCRCRAHSRCCRCGSAVCSPAQLPPLAVLLCMRRKSHPIPRFSMLQRAASSEAAPKCAHASGPNNPSPPAGRFPFRLSHTFALPALHRHANAGRRREPLAARGRCPGPTRRRGGLRPSGRRRLPAPPRCAPPRRRLCGRRGRGLPPGAVRRAHELPQAQLLPALPGHGGEQGYRAPHGCGAPHAPPARRCPGPAGESGRRTADLAAPSPSRPRRPKLLCADASGRPCTAHRRSACHPAQAQAGAALPPPPPPPPPPPAPPLPSGGSSSAPCPAPSPSTSATCSRCSATAASRRPSTACSRTARRSGSRTPSSSTPGACRPLLALWETKLQLFFLQK